MGIAQNGHPVANGARDESHGMQGSVENSVQDYYGKTLKTSKDLKTSACTAAGRPHPEIRKILKQLPSEVTDKFYGCGAPLPLGIDGCADPSCSRPFDRLQPQVAAVCEGCESLQTEGIGSWLWQWA